jgi:D-sedoheptulose 7-phosphate isomerase
MHDPNAQPRDPRFNNQVFPADTLDAYLDGYQVALKQALSSVDRTQLNKAYALMKDASIKGSTIYVAGNGGSAAISDHLCCDWMKGTAHDAHKHLKVVSLVSNTALVTALANDFGYDRIFEKQVDMLAEQGDVLVLISSSGKSPNILAALEVAQKRGVKTIGMSGFGGGALRERADVALHVDFANYGVVEDAHQILMHNLAQFLASERDRGV